MDVLDWEFLSEPLYKWFLFLGLLMIMLAGWRMILSYM